VSKQDGTSRQVSAERVDDPAAHIMHVDMDAFFASVELLERPELVGKPVIVGHRSQRSVVTAATYEARHFGVNSAMPMAVALRRCPHAVVLEPHFDRYAYYSKRVMQILGDITPHVEQLSVDEAFLDVAGARRLLGDSWTIGTRLRERVYSETGLRCSAGAAATKFVAKLASSRAKPDGLLVIPAAETVDFLAPRPISLIYGVGKVFSETLRKDGFTTIRQLQNHPLKDLVRRYGDSGARLSRLSRGEDSRPVSIDGEMKSVSSETTFNTDLSDFEALSTELLAQSERLSERLKAKGLVGDTVHLKLKSAGFRLRTRARALMIPTQLANVLYEHGVQLLAREIDGTAFRLIGIGVTGLEPASGSDPTDLLEPAIARKAAAERAMDRVRSRFGTDAVVRGKLYGRQTRPKTAENTERTDEK